MAHRLITVGRLARWIAEEAISAGMRREDVMSVDSNDEAIALLSELIERGDVVLVKGSRGMQMQGIVSALGRPTWHTP